ncbi:MAG: hypothetical protein DWP94_14795 [Flavobacterium sp.]|nr:MAG: hypothetical protein DWP94_14795 [Flavobacterium sp.]
MFRSFQIVAQVGINTTTPSPASILEISSTQDNVNFGGLMPPRVPTLANRNSINPSTSDIGLLVFVEEVLCYQVWNGTTWEDIHCLNTVSLLGIFQNFDLNSSWGYRSDVPFFDNGNNGFFGITDSSNGGFSNLTSMTNDFLGVNDLDDEGINGTTGFATITFNTINISAAPSGVTLSFNYEFFEFDNGDDAYYTISIDGIPQTEIQLIDGMANSSMSGTVSEIIPPGTTSVGLSIRFRQDGAGDYAGFDNFAIVPL